MLITVWSFTQCYFYSMTCNQILRCLRLNIAILDVSLSKPVCQCLLQLWYFYQCCCWNLGNLDNKTVCVLYTYRHNKRLTRIRRNLIRKKKLMSWALCLSLCKQFPKVELTKNIITFFSSHMHCSWSLHMF